MSLMSMQLWTLVDLAGVDAHEGYVREDHQIAAADIGNLLQGQVRALAVVAVVGFDAGYQLAAIQAVSG